ncbi:MAG: DEAD/DEAH box helicase [Proteobacteria bacterium]|nr:DEAD/DEAH box helicase [Pseudomonadota bacterium]
MTTFSSLGLAETLLRAVEAQGYSTPTPIQLQAIPAVLSGRDIMAAAQTGTGKTAAFSLPLLQRLAADAPAQRRTPRALILTPTRELAAQIQDCLTQYGANLKIKSAVIFGGVGINPQIDMLRRGIDILVATPGRLLDLYGQGEVNFSKLEVLILDEADRMLDMGFIHDIRKILKVLPPKRQNLLFSATFSDEIRQLGKGLLDRPLEITVTPERVAADTVTQEIYHVDKDQKPALLSHLIKQHDWHQVLVFTRTKHGADRLARKLVRDGIESAAIHGNKSQNARTRALDDFKAGRVQVLVATDIAARGIDIDQLPQVVNFELPHVAEDYVHRIGRTGRAGANGHAVSLVEREETGDLRGIERLLKRRLPVATAQGFVPQSASALRDDNAAEAEQRRARANPPPAARKANGSKPAAQNNRRRKRGASQANANGNSNANGNRGGNNANGNRAGNANGNVAPRHANGNQARRQSA